MRYVYAGDDVTILVRFIVDEEFVTPDDNSVFYTVRDNAGAPIGGLTAVAVPAANGLTSTPIVILAAHNTNAGLFENRSLSVSYAVLADPQTFETSYRVIPFVPKTAQPADVRAFLGLSTTELPDSDVDLIEAYFSLAAELGGTVLRDALTSGTLAAITANQALVYEAAVNVVPSLQTRILQQEQKDTTRYARIADFDFDAMAANAAAYRGAAVASLGGKTPVLPALVAVGGRTDVVTGLA